MSHHIIAILTTALVDAAAAERFDIRPIALNAGVTMLPIDHYFTAYWQARLQLTGTLDIPADYSAIFPRERVVERLARELGAEPFALVMTEYFGGNGDQWACVFHEGKRTSPDAFSINRALAALGVAKTPGLDEFDTVGLGKHRSSPSYLERYVALCDELGV